LKSTSRRNIVLDLFYFFFKEEEVLVRHNSKTKIKKKNKETIKNIYNNG